MKTRATVAISFSLLPFVSFSQSTDPKIIEAAKKEGEIIWYTSMSVDQSQPLMGAFNKKYPAIKPVLVRLGGGALMNRVLTETRAGLFGFDVVGGRGEMIQIFKERGIISSYLSPETRQIDGDLFDKQGFWYVHYVVPWVLGYNTQQVKKDEVPKTYEALLDPKWKGGGQDRTAEIVLESRDRDRMNTSHENCAPTAVNPSWTREGITDKKFF
jgi:spermidine/putrescine-binding protein